MVPDSTPPGESSRGRSQRRPAIAYDRPLTPEQIAAVEDESIDFSDIPELDEEFRDRAELVDTGAGGAHGIAIEVRPSGERQVKGRRNRRS